MRELVLSPVVLMSLSLGASLLLGAGSIDASGREKPDLAGRAVDYIKKNGRKVDRLLYEFLYENGSREAVIEEIRRYQNEDGGFGHGLEADLRCEASSPMTTAYALGMLKKAGAPSNSPVVQKAIRYLLANYDAKKGYWSSVFVTANSAPHAPWWHYSEQKGRCEAESPAFPTAEIVSHLRAHSSLVPTDFLEKVTRSTLDHLDSLPDRMEMMDVVGYIRLAEELPAPMKTGVIEKLKRAIPLIVERDPGKWSNYTPQPLVFVQSPDSPFYEMLRKEVERNLQYLIETQKQDGSWDPNWSWYGNYPEYWPAAKREINGILTLEKLGQLRTFSY